MELRHSMSNSRHCDPSRKFQFTIPQIACLCDILIKTKELSKLRTLISNIPKDWIKYPTYLGTNFCSDNDDSRQSILEAMAHLAFEDANYDMVHQLLEQNYFGPRHQYGMQQLWYASHYAQTTRTRGRNLSAVDKYRLRKKHPLPSTIWDGEETIYCFKKGVRQVLQRNYMENNYPTLVEKYRIAQETGLTFTQVSNWFKNHRQRDKTRTPKRSVQPHSFQPCFETEDPEKINKVNHSPDMNNQATFVNHSVLTPSSVHSLRPSDLTSANDGFKSHAPNYLLEDRQFHNVSFHSPPPPPNFAKPSLDDFSHYNAQISKQLHLNYHHSHFDQPEIRHYSYQNNPMPSYLSPIDHSYDSRWFRSSYYSPDKCWNGNGYQTSGFST